MTDTAPENARRRSGWWPGSAAVAVTAAAVSSLALRNQFPLDDKAIIYENATLHGLHKLPLILTSPYWPPYLAPDLYRPVTSTALMLQWVGGGGRPVLFHAVSLALYALSALAVHRLLHRLVPAWAAFAGALLFAVHPVHVEAVAAAVNQAEILVGLLCTVAAALWLRVRTTSAAIPAPVTALLALLMLAAAGAKESGLMLLPLLGAVEVTLVRDPRPWGARFTALRPTILTLALVGVAFVGVRTLVLADVVGSFTVETLKGQGLAGRALTMLGVVPVIARLLLWPAVLRVDYSPPEIERATAFGAPQAAGLALLVATALVAWGARRRAPVVTLGVLWFAIGYFPVHNVLVPTGIVLAERTLFLPSIGFALAVSGVLGAAAPSLAGLALRPRLAAVALLAAALGAGGARTLAGHEPWLGTNTLYRHEILSGARSYRTWWQFGQLLSDAGKQPEAQRLMEASLELWPHDPVVKTALATSYQRGDDCPRAIPLYLEVLRAHPMTDNARANLVMCLAWEGDYPAARRHARAGAADGSNVEVFSRMVAYADTAEQRGAPPHSVDLAPLVVAHSREKYARYLDP